MIPGASGSPAGKACGPFALTGVICALLALFLNKAYTVDDPLFLWLGRHLLEHPLDPFGFDVNWYGVAAPMHEVTMNPPLAGYFIALVGGLFGFSEPVLHAAFLLPAALACLATWRLAEELGADPRVACLAGLATPAFLVSSTSVMCDTWMLACFTWSVVHWRRGIERGDGRALALAGGLAALAVLFKYFALALVPLLCAHGWLARGRPGRWLWPLALPIGAALAFELFTRAAYGHGLVLGAGAYASGVRAEAGRPLAATALGGLVFAGGSLASAIFLAPLVLGRSALVLAGALALAALLAPPAHELLAAGAPLAVDGRLLDLEAWAMAFGGAALACLAVRELWRERDPDAALLCLWVAGTLAFAAGFNWTNNVRSNLPLAPAVGVLLARALRDERSPRRRRLVPAALALSAALALAVAWGDARWAGGWRDAAGELADEVPERTYFQGHWGFQYYAELAGATALDPSRDVLRKDDRVLRPSTSWHELDLPATHAVLEAQHEVGQPSLTHTMTTGSGAGFYSSSFGPVPFVVAPLPPERVQVWRITKRFGWKPE